MAMLEIRNIHKAFDGLGVLKGVSLSVEKGDVVAILGKSGSGKTTLLRCINFLETADDGELVFDGETVPLHNASKRDITDSRKETYDFSTPYAYIKTALVVAKDNDTIQSFEDLAGKTTANSIGSTYMEMAEAYGATCSGVDTLDETIQMVLQGRADATLNANVSFFDYLNQHPDAAIKIVAESEEANEIAIPMQKGDDTASLREAVNQAIEALRTEGKLSELSGKYFGADISSK